MSWETLSLTFFSFTTNCGLPFAARGGLYTFLTARGICFHVSQIFTSSILLNFLIHRIDVFFTYQFFSVYIYTLSYIIQHTPWKWEGSIFSLFVLCRKGFRYETCFTLGSSGGRGGTARTRNDGTCLHMKWKLILFGTTLKIMKNINLQLFHISLRSCDIYTCMIFTWDDL